MRWDIRRDRYRVDPGLYAAGEADETSPVLVTANYKYTFDVLRRELGKVPAWLLVLDTRGINVWCAAGKKRFSTDELAYRIRTSDLAAVVSHRRVVVPQLGATGVAAHLIRPRTGFGAVFGPVRAADIPAFLDAGMKATPEMREVRFGMWDRLVLSPVEFVAMMRHGLWAVPVLAALSLLGPWLGLGFQEGLGSALSAQLVTRALPGALAYVAGTVAGTFIVDALLPWLPGRQFWLKGAVAGGAVGLLAGWAATAAGWIPATGAIGLALISSAVAAWATMNFTGSSTYTNPTGVEAEMRRGIPIQAALLGIGLAVWIASAWLG